MQEAILLFFFMCSVGALFVLGWVVTVAAVAARALVLGLPINKEIEPLLKEW